MNIQSQGTRKRLRLMKETLRFFAADEGAAVGTNTFSGQCFTIGCTGAGATCLNEKSCLSNNSCCGES